MITIFLILIAIYLINHVNRILISPGRIFGRFRVVKREGDNLYLVSKDGKEDLFCSIKNVFLTKIKGIN